LNPIGLAAGFDKDGEAVDGIFNLGSIWVKIGRATPKPQPGNITPCVFHLPSDSALIKRYGLPSKDHISMLNPLRACLPTFTIDDPTSSDALPASLRPGSALAVNLGKNETSALDSINGFITGIEAFAPYANVLVVNVSSPSTPSLCVLQNRSLLENFSMVSPKPTNTRRQNHSRLTESEIIGVAEVVRSSQVDANIVSNTANRSSSLSDPNNAEIGGPSGPTPNLHPLNPSKSLFSPPSFNPSHRLRRDLIKCLGTRIRQSRFKDGLVEESKEGCEGERGEVELEGIETGTGTGEEERGECVSVDCGSGGV